MTKERKEPDSEKQKPLGSSSLKNDEPQNWHHSSSRTEADALKAMLKKKRSRDDTDADQK